MKYRVILLLSLILSLVNCKQIEEVEEDLDMFAVEEMAMTIEEDFNNLFTENLQKSFNPVLFTRRLGEDFKKRPAAERQQLYSIFSMIFKDNINTYVQELGKENLDISLFDIHKKNGVYRLNYLITGKVNEIEVANFLVFYVQKDRNDEMKIVNMYNVLKGFSFSQTITEYVEIVESNSRAMTRMATASNYRDAAAYQASLGNYQAAYDRMKTIKTKYLNTSNFAYVKVSFASQISDSLHIEELKWLRALTANEASKKMYDCTIDFIENKDVETNAACIEELTELLIKN